MRAFFSPHSHQQECKSVNRCELSVFLRVGEEIIRLEWLAGSQSDVIWRLCFAEQTVKHSRKATFSSRKYLISTESASSENTRLTIP